MNQNGGYSESVLVTISMQTQRPWGAFLVRKPGRAVHAGARRAGLSLPLSIRAGQCLWGSWRGRGWGRCRGLRGRGLRERRHRNTSADSETKSDPGRQPLGATPDGRMPLQVGGGREGGGESGLGKWTAADGMGPAPVAEHQ